MVNNNGAIRNPVDGSDENGRIESSERFLIEEPDDLPLDLNQGTSTARWSFLVMGKRFVAPLALVFVVLAILTLGGLFSQKSDAELPAARALDVEVVTAKEESSYDIQRSYLGTIESGRNSRLSFEVAGKLVAVSVDEGESVEQGALLAELDTKILESNRNVAQSQVASAQARLDELIAGPRVEDIDAAQASVRRWTSQLKLAQITSDRLVKLTNSRSIARQEADDAVYNEQVVSAQLDLAKSQLAELKNGTRKEQIAAQRALVSQLKAELGTIEINIEKSKLYAPYSGIISSRRLDEGEVITSGQPVFELLDNRQLEARVGLPADSIESVSQSTNHLLVYRKQKIVAKLKSVRPEKNSQTRTIDVVFSFDATAQPASVGDLVRLELPETISQTGFWIPTSALVETYRGLWGCYVAQPATGGSTNAVTKLRELEVLHQEGELAYVRGGLRRGEQVIVSGVHRLVPDQNVNLAFPQVNVASIR